MADVVVASCGRGRAQLIVEVDGTGTVIAARCESTIPATLTITRLSGTWTIDIGTGSRRVAIPANRQFAWANNTATFRLAAVN